MKKQILLLATLLALLTSCGTRAPHYDYRELAQAALRLDMDIDMDDNHRLYIESAHWIGVPYRSGGTTRRGVDCSGLTSNIYRTVYRKRLERSSDRQRTEDCRKCHPRRHLLERRTLHSCQYQPRGYRKPSERALLQTLLDARWKGEMN